MINDDYIKQRINGVKRPSAIHFNEEELNYLMNRYNDSFYIKEILYRILNNIDKKPKCKFCENFAKFSLDRNNYANTCDNEKCIKKQRTLTLSNNLMKKYGVDNVAKLESVKLKTRNTNIMKYGGPAPLSNENIRKKTEKTCLERYGCKNAWNNDKQKQTMKNKYGCENPSQSNIIKEKRKQTFINNFGVDNPGKSDIIKDKIKQTNLERYGCENVFQSEIIKSKIDYKDNIRKGFETKRKNGILNESISKEELEIFEKLKTKFPNTINQYRDEEKYPFNCDFYIPEIDTWIEYQGYYTHGSHPFNPNSEEDKLIIEKWKEHNNLSAIYNWTIRDHLKRETAKQNELKYLEFFTIKEFEEWFETQ